MDNFKLVSSAKPKILILVLTIDVLNENKLKLIFEHELQGCEKIFDVSEFIEELKKIDFKFLILFGSNTCKLSKKIKEQYLYEKDANILAF